MGGKGDGKTEPETGGERRQDVFRLEMCVHEATMST